MTWQAECRIMGLLTHHLMYINILEYLYKYCGLKGRKQKEKPKAQNYNISPVSYFHLELGVVYLWKRKALSHLQAQLCLCLTWRSWLSCNRRGLYLARDHPRPAGFYLRWLHVDNLILLKSQEFWLTLLYPVQSSRLLI